MASEAESRHTFNSKIESVYCGCDPYMYFKYRSFLFVSNYGTLANEYFFIIGIAI